MERLLIISIVGLVSMFVARSFCEHWIIVWWCGYIASALIRLYDVVTENKKRGKVK